MRGENADGITSFAPVDEGQMPLVTTPYFVRLVESSTGVPLFRSQLVAQFVGS